MRLQSRLFHFSLLAAVVFTVSAQAQEAISSGDWSDSFTWSGGAVPRAGDIVTIGPGLDVVVDVSPPGLNGIYVEGKLSFSNDRDLELTTEWILLRGELEILIIGETELAIEIHATERRRADVEDDIQPRANRDDVTGPWNGSAEPGR